MVSYNLVADISSHNPDSIEFFRKLRKMGVKAVIVKLTEGSNPGTAYMNPKAQRQINNTMSCGMRVHAYHFARFINESDAVQEARWFINNIKKMGLTSDSVMVVDVEAQGIPNNATASVNCFIREVKAAGYPNTDVYASASWFWSGRLIPRLLIPKNLWVAAYNNKAPGVDNVGTWQFTSKYNGLNLDMSYDFFGLYSKEKSIKELTKGDVTLDGFYRVCAGDSWWKIAYDHGMDMYYLAKLNRKTIQDVIYPGQILKIK